MTCGPLCDPELEEKINVQYPSIGITDDMKKLLGILTVLALLCLAGAAMAEIVESGTCGENLTWTLDDEGLLTISGTGRIRDCFSKAYKTLLVKKGLPKTAKVKK